MMLALRRFVPNTPLAARACGVILWGLLGSACDDSETPENGPGAAPPNDAGPSVPDAASGADDAAMDPCPTFGENDCSSRVGCRWVEAYSFHPERGCLTGGVRSGCVASQTCTAKPTLAQDDAGWLWQASGSCLPLGLVASSSTASLAPAGPCPAPEAEAACAAHKDRTSCQDDPNWTCAPMIFAAFDATRGCLSESPRFLGYMADRPCNGGSGTFRDAQGQIWEAGTSSQACVPSGWEAITPSSVRPDAQGSLPRCAAP